MYSNTVKPHIGVGSLKEPRETFNGLETIYDKAKHHRQSLALHTVMALFFTGRYFHEFHKKVAFRENITVNSCASVALLHLKQSAS